MRFITKARSFIDEQYGNPKGWLGWFIGEKMVRQHRIETLWTIKHLHLQKEEHVLELGCGGGYAMKLLLNNLDVCKVVGLDHSKTLIQSATIRNKKEIKKERAQLVHGNVQNLPFEDNKFSTVFSIHSIYFWEDLSLAVKEIHRVLKPGGLVAITLCNEKNGDVWEGVNTMIHNKLIPLMDDANFQDVKLVTGPLSRQYQTVLVTGEKL
ncbi:class I SAM-dependent methyltransferase [Pseudalkalibacillus hwajinpoensis]|uniref:Class I SAM-dependent methyltransferase n=1 Tax=Guptibacillus hwajinpoensis TaxID=208199 RepID=A0A4U1MPA5_9BACL|nr:class I SAM-dependent methyltransferase [Pseudalkalibacillus hwajinpoensis]TKD72350.1 class I SAM-dependent methyltransferase [Pseudalkalibacillus hwajinpoensis]